MLYDVNMQLCRCDWLLVLLISVQQPTVNGTEWPYMCWSAVKKLLTHSVQHCLYWGHIISRSSITFLTKTMQVIIRSNKETVW